MGFLAAEDESRFRREKSLPREAGKPFAEDDPQEERNGENACP